jgi:tetratricopeptide (TPR) repeat protein
MAQMARGWLRSIAVALAMVLMLLSAGVARADEPEEQRSRALALIKEGRARYDLGKFDEAILLFQQAYEVWPYPEALFNLAQAWRQKGDARKAVFYYRSYLRNKPDAANREEVEQRIAELEKNIAAEESAKEKPPEGTTTPTDKPPEEPQQPPADLYPPKQVEPEPAAPAPVQANPSWDAPQPRWYGDSWGWWLTGAGAVAAGIGVYLLIDAAQLEDDADAADESKAGALFEQANDRRTIGWPTLGAGAALLTAGIIKLAIPPERIPGQPTVSVGAASLDLSWTF